MAFEDEHGIKNRGREAMESIKKKKIMKAVKHPLRTMKEAIAKKMK